MHWQSIPCRRRRKHNMKAEFWTGSLPIVARFLYVGYHSVSPMNMDVILPLSSESSGRLGAGILLLFSIPGARVLASFFSSISLVPGCWHPSSLLYPWCPGAGILLLFYIPGACGCWHPSSLLYPWCPGAGILLLFYIPGARMLASFFSSISLVPGRWLPSSLLYPWWPGAGILLLFLSLVPGCWHPSSLLYPWCPGAGILLLF